MKLKVEHTTLFEYDALIFETATEVKLRPTNLNGSSQRCLEFDLQVTPSTSIYEYTDFYGNSVHHFNIMERHNRLEIIATSIVETGSGHTAVSPGEDIFLQDFLLASRYVQFDPAVLDYAQQFQAIADPYELAETVCRVTNETFTYESGVTGVHTTTSEVMELRQGVCQDFAHVMIAVCRHLKVPARYISGYLYGGPGTDGLNRSSHAWCEVFCGPEKGWIAFDPTHATLLVDQRYIKIGAGRDYADVPPVRGTYKGRAAEQLKVVVRIWRLDENNA